MSIQDAIALANGGGAGSNSVAAPSSQRYVLMKADPKTPPAADPSLPAAPPGFQWVQNVNYTPPSTKQPIEKVGSDEAGWYVYDPNDKSVTPVLAPHTPNADEEMTKAIDRQTREAERNERQANDAAGNGYVTASELATIQRGVAADKLGQDTLKQRIAEFSQTQKNADLKQATDDKVAAQNILQSQATVGQIAANTSQINQNIDVTKAKLPGELTQQAATQAGTEATTAYTDAQTARMKQLMGLDKVPTVQAAPTANQLYNYQRDPTTGAVTQAGMNPEFQAKTQADIAARVGQIHSLMQQKSAEVQGKVGSNGYTADNALQEFNQWYAQNVTPQQAQLQAAQQTAAAEQARQEAATRTAAYTAALGAGTQATNAFTASQAGRVGPGFAEAAKSGAFNKADFDPSVFSYQAPDINQTSQQAVMDALKYISPTAAQATGGPMPNYAGMDIAQGLDKTAYLPGGGGAPPPAAPVAAPQQAQPVGSSSASNPVNMVNMPGYGGGGQSTPLPTGMGAVNGTGGGIGAYLAYLAQQQQALNVGNYSFPG